jgi:hypothetical protein
MVAMPIDSPSRGTRVTAWSNSAAFARRVLGASRVRCVRATRASAGSLKPM